MRIVCVIFVFLFWQCSAPDYSEKLKFALQAARNNRPELEKVLAHYAAHPEDSLKWQAACFLIENMPGHYTAESDVLRAFRKRVDRDTVPYFSRKAFDVLISAIPEFNRYARKVEDVRHITADYLIRHIDASFELYGRFPWYENVPLADFFRYVLPYRIGNERLDLWRDSIKPTLPDEYWISSEIQSDYRKARQYLELGYDLNLHFTDTLVDQLYQKIAYECHYLNLKHLLRDRVLGIPSALDYFPHYANRNGLHYWVEDIDSRKRMSYIEGAAESQPAKVFRETFERHVVPTVQEEEYVPDLFLNPFLCDVTDEYLYAEDVAVPVAWGMTDRQQHAYLCVFNNLRWQPTAIGMLEDGKIKFENMGKGIVYLPVYYGKQGRQAFNYPFVLNVSGELEFLEPDTTDRFALRLERKYPYDGIQYSFSEALTDAAIVASNTTAEMDFDTVAFLPSENHYYLSVSLPDTLPAFRYWQVRASANIYFAETFFYDSAGIKVLPDSVFIGTYAFDGNILTNDLCPRVAVGFREPVRISRIVCLPRSDGNGVYPENVYELFYFAAGGWQSLGRKKAEDYFLDYENIPRGGLYWLRNLTTGVEERIFTYRNGMIRFW